MQEQRIFFFVFAVLLSLSLSSCQSQLWLNLKAPEQHCNDFWFSPRFSWGCCTIGFGHSPRHQLLADAACRVLCSSDDFLYSYSSYTRQRPLWFLKPRTASTTTRRRTTTSTTQATGPWPLCPVCVRCVSPLLVMCVLAVVYQQLTSSRQFYTRECARGVARATPIFQALFNKT